MFLRSVEEVVQTEQGPSEAGEAYYWLVLPWELVMISLEISLSNYHFLEYDLHHVTLNRLLFMVY